VPELPDVTLYVESLAARVQGSPLVGVRVATPFLVRTFDPPLSEVRGRTVRGVSRLGKRIVLELEGDLFVVVHLMVAGRLRWRPAGAALPGRVGQAAFDFPEGTLLLTEASTKKRASLHVLRGREALADFDRGGIEPLEATLGEFADALRRENHTLKRSLTDPRLFSGIGNAYSDEILFWACLSPVKRTSSLDDGEIERLFVATRHTLRAWTRFLRAELRGEFPEKVTAFREEMAVHGRYGQPCRVCGTKVQRIRFAENEVNYCPRCQTGGKLLADRSLSRLLKGDWPRSIAELEERQAARAPSADLKPRSPGNDGTPPDRSSG
jgi:formamidopyrimidine-DNA glycosylase